MQLYIIYASTRTKQHPTHKKPSNTRATKYPSKKTATTSRFNECIFYFSISISQPAQPTSFRSPQLKGLGKDKISRRKRKVIASCFVINSRECAPQKKEIQRAHANSIFAGAILWSAAGIGADILFYIA